MYWADEKFIRGFGGETWKEGVRLEELGVDGFIILNKTLNKEDGKA